MKATWLLRLYPRAWRDRYEAEFRAVLDQRHATVMTLLESSWAPWMRICIHRSERGVC